VGLRFLFSLLIVAEFVSYPGEEQKVHPSSIRYKYLTLP
jgi:hypothetical protein